MVDTLAVLNNLTTLMALTTLNALAVLNTLNSSRKAANPDWQVDFGLAASSSHLPQVPLAQHLHFPQDVARLGKTISDFPDATLLDLQC